MKDNTCLVPCTNLSRFLSIINIQQLFSVSATVIEHAPLEAVYIFFDTATYDQIERDVKVSVFQNTMIEDVIMRMIMLGKGRCQKKMKT